MKLNVKNLLLSVLINIMPFVCVFVFDYSPMELCWVYFAESIFVGVLNVFKMVFAASDNPAMHILKAFLVPFFLVHYNGFMLVQSIFLYTFTFPDQQSNVQLFVGFDHIMDLLVDSRFLPALVGVMIAQLVLFYKEFIREKEWKAYPEQGPAAFMFQPYKRVFVQQIVVIFGAFLFLTFNAPIVFLALLVFLKMSIDYFWVVNRAQ